jgi:hypothetical protein
MLFLLVVPSSTLIMWAGAYVVGAWQCFLSDCLYITSRTHRILFFRWVTTYFSHFILAATSVMWNRQWRSYGVGRDPPDIRPRNGPPPSPTSTPCDESPSIDRGGGVTSIPLWRSSPRVPQEPPSPLSDPIFPYLRYYHVSLDLLLRLQFHFSIVQNHVDFASFVGFRGRFSLPLHVVLCACTHGSVVDCLSLSNYRFRAVI